MLNQENQDIFLLPHISKDDIDQEIELLKLETGIERVSRSIIIKKLRKQERAVLSSFDMEIDFTPLWQESSFTVAQLQAIEQILDWASHQNDLIQAEVFRFLDEPSHDNLREIINLLVDNGIINRTSRRRAVKVKQQHRRSFSLTQLIIKALKTRSYMIDDLYELARQNSSAERPEAAVRQTLRRLVRKGYVIQTGDIYQWQQT